MWKSCQKVVKMHAPEPLGQYSMCIHMVMAPYGCTLDVARRGPFPHPKRTMKASQILPIILLPLALAFTACTSVSEVTAEDTTAGAAAAENAATEASDAMDTAKDMGTEAAGAVASMIEGVHSVECGCSDAVTSTKKCGNYVQVDGKYLPIEGDLGLGAMEWCGKHGVNAQVKGEVKDGKFMGESLTVVP